MKNSFIAILLSLFSGLEGCNENQIESACRGDDACESPCVNPMAFLVGGRNGEGWRSDAEMINFGGQQQIQIADYPYKIDVPYGFWAGPDFGLVVCGGKNWNSELVDNKCWRFKPCSDTWEHVTDMPYNSSGGSGIPIQNSDGGMSLWIIGGGNGDGAITHTQILTPSLDENGQEVWNWRLGPSLTTGRYGGCGVLHKQAGQIYIIGGRDNDVIHHSMEIINPFEATSEVMEGWEMPITRWGTSCEYLVDAQGEGKIAIMGGMDQFFIPHKNLHLINQFGEVEEGADLPWAMSGQIGVPLNGQPTVIGGYSTLFSLKTKIASFNEGAWVTWDTELTSARVSGLAVQVPEDIFDQC